MNQQKSQKTPVPQRKNIFADLEKEMLNFWNATDAFRKSVEMRPADRQYTFYDGPPFATGLPHYGHISVGVIKDTVGRYWTMRGYRVERVWGWDCHGLPMENIIEKQLGLNGRKDIEEFGVGKFNEACRAAVLQYEDEWKKIIPRLGRWIDMDHAYKTMDTSYTESVWWVFSQLWKKGLIYEGRKAMHVCPRCVTPLSNFEVTLGYKDVEDLAVTWKFPVVGQPKTSFLAWTTTPWSTPGTMGLSVGPDFTYVKAQVGDEFFYVVKDRAEAVFGAGAYTVVEEVKGNALVGLEYTPIVDWYRSLPEVADNANAYHVFAADYVETTEGTGIVTINGAYGEIDMEAAHTNSLPLILDVNMDGLFNEKAPPLKGMYVKKAQKKLMEDMIAAGRVFKHEPYMHSYPHCWRCDTPLLNYATSSWFVKVTAIKEQLLANNQKIRWVPEHIKDGRFGTWLENARDWAISRSRFWGAPLPVWRSEDGEVICVGSVAELESLSGHKVTDLHKHIIDPITIERDGKTYTRIPEVLDCWFESGSMPYGQMHYPFEHADDFAQHFPAQFIGEAQDQTRGWFYTLHVLATALTSGDAPSIPVAESTPAFQNVIVNGIVLAEDGKKMSKKLKNYPDPMLVVEKYGADALRLYIAASPLMEGESLNFSEADVDQVQKKYINTLWNVFTFYTMFAEREQGITPVGSPNEVTDVMDRWILAKLHQLISEVHHGYETYRMRQATQPLVDFVQELSTWYVRRIRSRVKGESAEDRLAALRTLHTVLKTLSMVAAPITPFISEKIYQALRTASNPQSVHHTDWPAAQQVFVDESVLNEMQLVRVAIEQSLALRAEAGMKVRQPLQSATLVGKPIGKALQVVVCEELNVKEVKFGDTPALDTQITEELKLEGMLRELVRQTNALRKQAKLSIGDRITITVQTESLLVQKMLDAHIAEYQQSVLAEVVTRVDAVQLHKMDIDGENISISFA
jgi:isoleucyl-tRNA synthetase